MGRKPPMVLSNEILKNVDKKRERQHYFVPFYFEGKSRRNKKEHGLADGWEDTDNMVCSEFSFTSIPAHSKNIKTSTLEFITDLLKAAVREIGLRSCSNS